ncbi:beta-lactamase family protein [Microbacterium sp. cx-55]|uniref:serine hydrolase domain-containing protein n=1 Tax=Microbacterium sp. cx-55 TaxID=2875948 RepID=UPI001CBCCE9F|nr:serine hydrolase domain-containing protein [Microbacterium sp. cx-55]MBZ4486741.1 beta-lactamase family protein [Microbacterium sp. cx-55]UGB36302.1 beta-lactamase family protein [Microbacterium sp. cx-55]
MRPLYEGHPEAPVAEPARGADLWTPRGFAEPGYGAVVDAFADAAAASPRGGAALTIMVEGRTVVDLQAGVADPAGRLWDRDTPTGVFSCSKGLLAALVSRLVMAGLVDLDRPVSFYWPEFAQAGKESVPVRWLLTHQAGLSYPVEDVEKADVIAWSPVVDKLAAQKPLWEPGTGWAYHALTMGWLVGEVIRRVTGRSVGEAFRDHLSDPIGASASLGAPHMAQRPVAQMAPIPGFSRNSLAGVDGAEDIARSFTLGGAFPIELVGPAAGFNDPDLQAADIPAGGVIATAADLAALWSSAIIPTETSRPIDPLVLSDMTVRRTFGEPVFGIAGTPTPQWGTGYMIHSPERPLLSPASFGHDGAGGQLAFADSDHGVGFGFVTNDLRGEGDTRSLDILTALQNTL